MKIAVYTICKNESSFVQRWWDSTVDADEVVVVDTGSTDGTKEKFSQLKNVKFFSCSVTPWRFDTARNISLGLISEDVDVCICLDMDEILVPGWRKIIEEKFIVGITRLRYNYIWSWENNKPSVTYHADKIHARHGFRWVNPVHEVLVRDSRSTPEKQLFIPDTLIEHYPDSTKSRSEYLPLMELAVKENPNDDRMTHYYARELMFKGRYEEAAEEFIRHIRMPEATWASEKAASHRYLGDCYWALGAHHEAIEQFIIASQIVPNEREAWVSLAQAFRAKKDWVACRDYCKIALEIKHKPNTYINWANAWSDWPQRMLEEAETNILTLEKE